MNIERGALVSALILLSFCCCALPYVLPFVLLTSFSIAQPEGTMTIFFLFIFLDIVNRTVACSFSCRLNSNRVAFDRLEYIMVSSIIVHP